MSTSVQQPIKTNEQRGCFITFEGIDGAGKSTHVGWLVQQLESQGIAAIHTREPGGTELGEQLRKILLHQPMHWGSETLLMFAARNEHLETLIRPALSQGTWVICDRFTDATYAYQGGGRNISAQRIAELEHWVHADLQPDCTFLFDVSVATAHKRVLQGREPDRFEHEQAQFFERTQRVYRERAAQEPERFCIIDTSGPISATHNCLQQKLDFLINRFGHSDAVS